MVGPGNSYLSSLTPWTYLCRAVASSRMLRRTAAILRLLSMSVCTGSGLEIFGERLDQLLYQIDRGDEGEFGYGVVMHLAVVGDTEVSF